MRVPYRHVYLLVSLVLLILVEPFLTEVTVGFTLVDVFLVLTLASSVLACATARYQTVIGLALLVAVQIARWLPDLTLHGAGLVAYLGLALVFFLYVTTLVLRDVFVGTKAVSADSICGAISVYMMIGLLWALAYALLEAVQPSSFSFGGNAPAREVATFERFIGFSFVTLTTLGYGNIVPATSRAEALATAEAMLGQVYLTVLVARLVALQISQSKTGRPSD